MPTWEVKSLLLLSSARRSDTLTCLIVNWRNSIFHHREVIEADCTVVTGLFVAAKIAQPEIEISALFLDVRVPEGLRGGKVPVLHWLYGGAYIFGSKDWAGDPGALFQNMSPDQKFITVSSNYRLGNLGWISSNGEDMVKNAGLWDALTALEWTKKYISYFGGDPNDIILMGKSAGSGMGQHLITACWGGEKVVPFRKAILTSPGYRPHVNRSQEMTVIYNAFLNSTRCDGVDCLRSLSTDAIIAANQDLLFNAPRSGWLGPEIGYGPIIDGDLVPDLPDRLLRAGKYQRSIEKVLTANMANDGVYNVVSLATSWCEQLSYFMSTPTQAAIDAVSFLYPSNLTVAFDLFAGDASFACHSYWTAHAFNHDAYRYSMSIPPATHGQDQYYYLYTGLQDNGYVTYPDIALELQQRLRMFILEGRTGGDGCASAHWPSCGTGGRWMNVTVEGLKLVQNETYQADRCDLLMALINDQANGW